MKRLLLAALLLVGCSLAAQAQGVRAQNIVLDGTGHPVAGASIRVCTQPISGQPCTPLATLYGNTALTTPLANPTASDGLGNYFFYVAPGTYSVEISGPGLVDTIYPDQNFNTSATFTGGTIPNPVSFTGSPEWTVLCTDNLTADTAAFWGTVATAAAQHPTNNVIAIRAAYPAYQCQVDGSAGQLDRANFYSGLILDYVNIVWTNRGLYVTDASGVTNWSIIGVMGSATNSFQQPGSAPQWSVNGNFPALEVNAGLSGAYVSNWTVDNIVFLGGSGTTLGSQSTVWLHGQNLLSWKMSRVSIYQQAGTYALAIQGSAANQTYNGTLDSVTISNDAGGGNVGGGLLYVSNFSYLQFLTNYGENTFQCDGGPATGGPGTGQFPIHLEYALDIDMRKTMNLFEGCGGLYSGSAPAYNSGTTYGQFNRIVYMGMDYDSLVNSNTGNAPNASSPYTNAYWVPSYGALFEFGGTTGSTLLLGTATATDSFINNIYTVQNNGSGNAIVDTSVSNVTQGDNAYKLFSPYGTQIGYQLSGLSGGILCNEYTTIGGNQMPSGAFPYSPCAQSTDDSWRNGVAVTPRYANLVSNNTFTGNVSNALISATGVTDEYGGTQAFTMHGSGQLSFYHQGSTANGTIIEAVVSVRPHAQLQGQSPIFIACGLTTDCVQLAGAAMSDQFNAGGTLDENGWYRYKMVGYVTASPTSSVDVYLNVSTGNDLDFSHLVVRVIPAAAESQFDAMKETIALTPYSPLCAANQPCTIYGSVMTGAFSTQTMAYTLLITDGWVNVTGTTTVKAPHAIPGHTWTVFNSGSNTVTLEADSGNFNGTTSVSLSANTGMQVTCDGTNCFGH